MAAICETEYTKTINISTRINDETYANICKMAKSYAMSNSAFIEAILHQIFNTNFDSEEFSLLDFNKKQKVNQMNEKIRIMENDIKLAHQIIRKMCIGMERLDFLSVNENEGRRNIEEEFEKPFDI